MKQYLLLSLLVLVSACSHCNRNRVAEPAPQPYVYEEPQFVPYEPVEVNPCQCAYQPDSCREIQKPRIVEEKVLEPRRHCPGDSQFLDCGCGQCNTFAPAEPRAEPIVETFVPDMPQAYNLASNRIFNRFIRDTYNIYSQNPNIKVYVRHPVVKNDDLPGGALSGVETFKNQLQSSHTFALTNSADDADYILNTTTEWFDTPSKPVPAVKYTVDLLSKDGNPVNSWVEIVKKPEQTQSWL